MRKRMLGEREVNRSGIIPFSRRCAGAQTFSEADQVAIGVLNEEFALATLLVADPIPDFIPLLGERSFASARAFSTGAMRTTTI